VFLYVVASGDASDFYLWITFSIILLGTIFYDFFDYTNLSHAVLFILLHIAISVLPFLLTWAGMLLKKENAKPR
jgi:hypothetical protein